MHSDFAWLHALHQAGAFFVTLAKSPMNARRVHSAATDCTTGIVCDQRMTLKTCYSTKRHSGSLRRIRFNASGTGEALLLR